MIAILLNGEKPVEVTMEKINEPKIVFDSRDMDVMESLQLSNPFRQQGILLILLPSRKPASLPVALSQKKDMNCGNSARLGGGFVMHSEVTNVPKGSRSGHFIYPFCSLM